MTALLCYTVWMHRLIDELESVEGSRIGNAKKQEFFRQYLELPAGIPFHDTVNRVFAIREPVVPELPELDSTICQNKGRFNYRH